MLPRRRLGQTELEPSVIGLGTVKFGRTQNLKYPSDFALPSDDQLRELLACARDMGINLLDTAPAYGHSEERLGELLRRERQDWLICTKVGEEFEHTPFSPQGKSWFDFSARHTRLSLERSLRRLRSDYLDLVLIHSDGNDLHILEQTEVLDCLQQMKREGWIRALGISSKTLEGGQRAAMLCDAVMVTYHRDHTEEEGVIDACQAAGCGVLLKKVLASGHICHDAPASGAADPVQQALAFALNKAGVTSALLGTINPAHLRANCLKALAAVAQ